MRARRYVHILGGGAKGGEEDDGAGARTPVAAPAPAPHSRQTAAPVASRSPAVTTAVVVRSATSGLHMIALSMLAAWLVYGVAQLKRDVARLLAMQDSAAAARAAMPLRM